MKRIPREIARYTILWPSFWIATGVINLYTWLWDESQDWEGDEDAYMHKKIIWEFKQLRNRVKEMIQDK